MTTLEQRITAHLEIHRFTLDVHAEPYPRMRCWCGASMEVDYSQGRVEMNLRLAKFCGEHKACPPPEDV
jgi:hypothetical protein